MLIVLAVLNTVLIIDVFATPWLYSTTMFLTHCIRLSCLFCNLCFYLVNETILYPK